jgi:hypothetical protein
MLCGDKRLVFLPATIFKFPFALKYLGARKRALARLDGYLKMLVHQAIARSRLKPFSERSNDPALANVCCRRGKVRAKRAASAGANAKPKKTGKVTTMEDSLGRLQPCRAVE